MLPASARFREPGAAFREPEQAHPSPSSTSTLQGPSAPCSCQQGQPRLTHPGPLRSPCVPVHSSRFWHPRHYPQLCCHLWLSRASHPHPQTPQSVPVAPTRHPTTQLQPPASLPLSQQPWASQLLPERMTWAILSDTGKPPGGGRMGLMALDLNTLAPGGGSQSRGTTVSNLASHNLRR